jgi:hypothetical protein
MRHFALFFCYIRFKALLTENISLLYLFLSLISIIYTGKTYLNLWGIFRRGYNLSGRNFNQEKVIGMLMCYRERNEKYILAQD